MPLKIHKEHFQGIVDKNKSLRQRLKECDKFRWDSGDWLVVEAVPFDEEMVYCYDETYHQYKISFRDINLATLETTPRTIYE